MTYVLGVDVGHALTVAAARGFDADHAGVFPLGDHTAGVESVLYLADDNTVLVGSSAVARRDPHRTARGFAAQAGNGIPVVLGGTPFTAEALLAVLVGWVADAAADTANADPALVALAVPADWGPHRCAVLASTLDEVGLAGTVLVPAPLAILEAQHAAHPVPDGATVLVLDLGARTTAAAVVRSGSDGVELLAAAESAEPLAGELLDDLLAPYVPVGQCRAVRERLSVEQAAAVPGEEGRLTRAAAEELFRPVLGAVLDLAHHVCRPFGRPDVVLVAGGLAHTPLVVELAHAVGRPVVVADPATAAARGAAHVAHRLAAPPRVSIQADEPAEPGVPELPDTPPRPPVDLEPLAVPRRGARRWLSPTLARRPGGDR